MFTELSFNYELVKINEHACRGLFYVTSVLSWGYLGNKEIVQFRHSPEENYIRLAAVQRLTTVEDWSTCQTLLQINLPIYVLYYIVTASRSVPASLNAVAVWTSRQNIQGVHYTETNYHPTISNFHVSRSVFVCHCTDRDPPLGPTTDIFLVLCWGSKFDLVLGFTLRKLLHKCNP